MVILTYIFKYINTYIIRKDITEIRAPLTTECIEGIATDYEERKQKYILQNIRKLNIWTYAHICTVFSEQMWAFILFEY